MVLGRWPEKSVKFITRLLKNAESNADAKNIDVEDLEIKNIVVQQAPVSMVRLVQLLDTDFYACRKHAAARIVHMVVSTRTRATLAMSKSFSLQRRQRWRRPLTRRCRL